MRPTTLRALAGSALLSLAAQPADATYAHSHLHSRHSGNHTHDHDHDSQELLKRGKLVNRSGECAFPEDAGLVIVTPDSMNRGWAMSPDQECTADSFCPYACPPGQLMNQWKPGSTYKYPDSMAGGLYCDKFGKITKPFPSEDYCVDGIGNVHAVNNCGGTVAVCQTVLPGNEAMLIPTRVDSRATIAVPGTSYWDSTASHFYVNPPGYTTEEACVWGDGIDAIGNWAAYVVGANQDASGNTFVKLGYNPIYTDAYPGVKPTFGLKIECDGTCVGLPCSIDPGTDAFGAVNSEESATGAGGADFCVVTVTSGSARIVIFNTDGSTGESLSSQSSSAASEPDPTPQQADPTTSSLKAVVVVGLHAEATSSTGSSTTPTQSSTPTTSSSDKESTTKHVETTTEPATTATPTSSRYPSTSLKSYSAQSSAVHGGIFHETDDTVNGTTSSDSATVTSSADLTDSTAANLTGTSSSKSNASKDQAAFAGLVVAIVAAACLY